MEEKIIIQGKIPNIKLVRNVIWIIGVVAIVPVVLAAISHAEAQRNWYEYGLYAKWGEGDNIYSIGEFLGVVFDYCFCYGGALIWGPIVVCLLLGWLFYRGASKITMTVTDKRVYGTTIFGKQVDLPLDKISAVGKGMFKSVAVATASGTIKFSFIENRDAIHTAISKLLVDRQSKPVSATTIKPEIPQSNADELKKYKELLDSGVISQEEFDAKKKQLLGL